MKKIFLIVFCLMTYVRADAQNQRGQNVVSSFGQYLGSWCRSNSYQQKKAAVNECAGPDGRDCLVKDSLMMEFERRRKRALDKSYPLSSYMAGFQMEMANGKRINVSISNVRPVTNYSFDASSKQDNKRYSFYFVSADVNVTGAMNYTSRDLFYVRKGAVPKISTIAPYHNGESGSGRGREEVIINTSNVKDWNHIANGEYNAIGASYGYSKYFPVNIAVRANFSYFDFGLEYGKSTSDSPLKFVEHTNFATSAIDGNCYYLMATPGVFLHFMSINCGLGSVFTKYKYESVYSSYDESKNTFIMKPMVTFHVPVPFDFSTSTEKVYISPYVGYVYAPKFPKLNCWEAGIGLRIRLVN